MEDKLSIEPLDNVRVRVVMEYGPSLGARRVRGFSWFCGVMRLRGAKVLGADADEIITFHLKDYYSLLNYLRP